MNKPTHLVLNFGWWPHYRDIDRLEPLFNAALAVVDNDPSRVLWKGGTPASDGQPTPFVELERKVKMLAYEKNMLTYVPFPKTYEEVGKECFCDRVHFCCPELYRAHNQLISEHIETITN